MRDLENECRFVVLTRRYGLADGAWDGAWGGAWAVRVAAWRCDRASTLS